MALKVNLDALIQREDFEVDDHEFRGIGKNTSTLSISDLKEGAFFFSTVRKPDFQRETNEWDSEKICDLIDSFLNGELIPAIILWRSAGSFTFVIDGSHRISALAAWVNDDYGDGKISKLFYDGIIPEEQLEIGESTRTLVKKRIGLFSDYELALRYPDKVKPEIATKAKSLGALAVQLQWVEGDASTAESSFFKINQSAAPIDKTELRLIKARKAPNGVAARAIVRSGKGHKYWARFDEERQSTIQKISSEINGILFTPQLTTPIKTLDLPIGGKLYSAQTLPLVVDFVNIVNSVKLKPNEELPDDVDGTQTIKYLTNCKRIARIINSNHPSSLGLHPIVYFYSPSGRYKIASFFAVTALIMEFEKRNSFAEFIKVREPLEYLLVKYDYLTQQIVRRHRSALNSYEYLKQFYLVIIKRLLDVKEEPDDIIREIVKSSEFSYLTEDVSKNSTLTRDFSREVKSAAFIKEALDGALKCNLCRGYIHRNALSFDHIVRKQDGGTGSLDNAQITHPYCNSTVKN